MRWEVDTHLVAAWKEKHPIVMRETVGTHGYTRRRWVMITVMIVLGMSLQLNIRGRIPTNDLSPVRPPLLFVALLISLRIGIPENDFTVCSP